ncbi:MAG: IscS subfamily cysteine desulfurase [Chitinophagaceae bacterium]
MLSFPIYLDYNATTPCDPAVVEAMLPYFTKSFGNAASRNHVFGWQAEEAVDMAREQVAALINAEHKEIVFTSGATESANLALKGIYELHAGSLHNNGAHIITSNIEHKAVLDTCAHIEKNSGEVTYLPVNHKGVINLQELEAAIRPNTVLIAIMYANNEIGTIMPVKEISAIARRKGILFFSDATQAVGKISVDVEKDGIDCMAFSAHKLYGPKGIGALYVRRKNPRVRLTAQMDGGGHEKGFRSGTLNVPGIVGFGKACEIAMHSMNEESQRIRHLRDKLESSLLKIDEVFLNGNRENRLPNIANLSFRFVDGEGLLMGLNKTIAVSSGSACTSASMEPSYVLKALGLGDDLAHSSIRFGIGRYTTDEEIDYTIGQVIKTINKLRETSPVWDMYKKGVDIDLTEWTHQ